MNCQQARLLIGADPYATSADLEEHLSGCPACSEFRAQMVALEGSIRRALQQNPPLAPLLNEPVTPADSGTVPVMSAGVYRRAIAVPRPRRLATWRPWALAASILLTITATTLVWLLRPADSLARQIAVHVSGEPLSWNSVSPVNAGYLQQLLERAGVSSKVTSGEVMYAQTCLFRGHYVPHLVVQTASGPITVMILPNEHVRRRQSFYEGGFAGVIVPAQHGSIAVLARGTADIDDVAADMRRKFQSR